MIRSKQTLKTYFETGDKPTEQQFCDLIDSLAHQNDVQGTVEQCFADNQFTHEELVALKSQGKLIPSKKYLLTDYQTEYFIAGSNSAPIIDTKVIDNIVSNYAAYDPPLNLPVGTAVTVASLPSNYSGSINVGDVTTVSQNFSEGYFLRFQNGLHLVLNASFSFSVPRYRSIAENAEINDPYGKPVMRPGGIINTEVHDGTDYMDMLAKENMAPPIEKIVLTAISASEFSQVAESLTFTGDILEYDFNDRKIENEDGIGIGTRKGLVKRRINKDLNIDIDKDWRAQRFRRYRGSAPTIGEQVNLENPLYQFSNVSAVTLANENITDDHFYIVPAVENKSFKLDFTKGDAAQNPFLDGVDTAQGLLFGTRTYYPSPYLEDVYISDPAKAKDILILPLDKDHQPVGITQCKVRKLHNTVFRDLSQQVGNFTQHSIEATEINSSTITTTSTIRSLEPILRLTTLDRMLLYNKGDINGLTTMVYIDMKNAGELANVTIGSMPGSAGGVGVSYHNIRFDANCHVRDCILGGKRVDYWDFSNVTAKECLLLHRQGANISYYDSKFYLTSIKDTNNKESLGIKGNTFKGKNPKTDHYGHYYLPENEVPDADASLQGALNDLYYGRINSTGDLETTLCYTLQSPNSQAL